MIICSNDHIPRTFLFAQCWKTCQYFSVNSAIPFTIFFISREKLAFLTDGWQAILSPVAFFLLTDDNNVLLLMPIWELYFIVCQKDTAITFFSSINIDDFQRWNLRTSFACKWVLSWAYCLVKLSNPLKGNPTQIVRVLNWLVLYRHTPTLIGSVLLSSNRWIILTVLVYTNIHTPHAHAEWWLWLLCRIIVIRYHCCLLQRYDWWYSSIICGQYSGRHGGVGYWRVRVDHGRISARVCSYRTVSGSSGRRRW